MYCCDTCGGMFLHDSAGGRCPSCQSDLMPIAGDVDKKTCEVDTGEKFKGADISKHGIKGRAF